MGKKEREALKVIKEAWPLMDDRMKGKFEGTAETLIDLHRQKEKEDGNREQQ